MNNLNYTHSLNKMSKSTDRRFENTSSVIVKLTNRCNIRCSYCYEDIIKKGSDMSSETFQQMTTSILSSTKAEEVLFILHGGEPTILSNEWFEENLKKAYDIANLYNKKLQFSIQTNLINIDENKLKLFRDFNVSIGGSIDNPDFLSESLRPLAKKALDTYCKAKNLGIRVGILATINSSNITSMTPFCNWLSNSLGVKHFKANIAYSVGAGVELSIPTPVSFFNAQKDILEFMLKMDGEFIEDNLWQEIIRFFENSKAAKKRVNTLCDDLQCGAGSKVVGVTPKGDLLPCGRFAWSDKHYFLGNIDDNETEKSSIFFEKLNQFQKLNPENWQHCDSCEAKDICSFGCQGFIVRSKIKINIECEPTKLRYRYYNDNIDRFQRLYEKICEKQNRPSISPIEQKISKLKSITPPIYYSVIHYQ